LEALRVLELSMLGRGEDWRGQRRRRAWVSGVGEWGSEVNGGGDEASDRRGSAPGRVRCTRPRAEQSYVSE